MKRLTALLVISGIATALVIVVASSHGGHTANAASTLKDCPADGSANFDEYTVGASFDGNAANPRHRQCDPANFGAGAGQPPTRVNVAETTYGRCAPIGSETSCSLPVDVQSWPACERNLSLYTRYPGPDGPIRHTTGTLRGVPVAYFDEGQRIEVYTGDATIVVATNSAARAKAAVLALRGRHGGSPVGPTDQLPAPDAGALDGTLAC